MIRPTRLLDSLNNVELTESIYYTLYTSEMIELINYLKALEKENNLRKSIINQLPLCPDHRDKQTGKSCLACRVDELEMKIIADFVFSKEE